MNGFLSALQFQDKASSVNAQSLAELNDFIPASTRSHSHVSGVLLDSFAIVDLVLDNPFVEDHDFSVLLDSLAIADLVLESPYIEGRDFDDQAHDER